MADSSLSFLGSLGALPSFNPSSAPQTAAGFGTGGSGAPRRSAVTSTPAARSLLGERTTRDWSSVLSRPNKQAKVNTAGANGNGNNGDPKQHQLFQTSVRDRRAAIMENIISTKRAEVFQRVQEQQAQQLAQARDRLREQIMNECVGPNGRRMGGALTMHEEKKDDNNQKLKLLTGPGGSTSSTSASEPLMLLDQHHPNKLPKISSQDLDQRIQSHAKAVQDSYSGQNISASPTDLLLQNLINITKDATAGGSDVIPFEISYLSALRLVQFVKSNPATGALLFLCHETRSIIERRVAQARAAGQDASSGDGSFGSAVSSYVRLTFGSHGHTLYHILYFCLRCGDASAAKSSMDMAAARGERVDASIREAINTLHERQGNSSCLWEVQKDGDSSPLVLPFTVVQGIDHLHQQRHLNSDNIYFTATLALLSGGQIKLPSSGSDDGLNTIEDYMFGHFIVPEASDAASKVSAIIRQSGPAHFDYRTWSFVLPLLVSQDYPTALAYLARTGGTLGLLQATHLGMILGEGEDLLVSYATEIAVRDNRSAMSTLMALEYLLRIPDSARLEKEISSLVSASYGFIQLHGTISADGMRENSLLDEKLPRDQVNRIMSLAARSFTSQHTYHRGNVEAAGVLFLLSGDYGSFLAFLNQLLSSPDKPENDKGFWCEQSKMFHSTYMEKRTRVLEVLERDNQLGLVNTNVLLMKLYDFFGLFRQNNFEEARNLIYSLTDLLPTSQDDIKAKVQRYRQLDPVVQFCMPNVLLATMECLLQTRAYVEGAVLATFAGYVLDDDRVMGQISRIRSAMR